MLLGNENEVIERLKNETDVLDKNIEKLTVFLDSEDFEKLSFTEKNLLCLQKQSMLLYSSILHTRTGIICERIINK